MGDGFHFQNSVEERTGKEENCNLSVLTFNR